jgi:hypothetical protein
LNPNRNEEVSFSGTEPRVTVYDPALPGSILLKQPPQLVQVLSSTLEHWLGSEGRILEAQVAVRRHVPGKRCIVDLELLIETDSRRSTTSQRVVGKLYARHLGVNAYETLRRLWAHGFATGESMVPRPLAYASDWQLVLLSWAKGDSLRHLLLAQQDVSPIIERAAQWLLKLHTCGITYGRLYTFSDHLHTLTRWERHLAEVYPQAARRYVDVLHVVEKRGSQFAGWTPGPTHRDFSPDHLIVDGNRLTGLDFDEFCQYDPLFDVGHFIAHLQLLGLEYFGSLHHFTSLVEIFKTSYAAGAKEYSEDRLHLYQAITYLKLAHILAYITQPVHWEWMVNSLVQESRQLV